MSTVRVVTLGSGREVTLGAYVRAVKTAKAQPDSWFREGFDGWGCYGREAVRQFRRAMHDRINQGVPYSRRGVTNVQGTDQNR